MKKGFLKKLSSPFGKSKGREDFTDNKGNSSSATNEKAFASDSVTKKLPPVTPAAFLLEAEEDIESGDSADGQGPEELAEIPSNHTRLKGRQSVSAEAYGEWNKRTAFIPPCYPRSEDQIERISGALSNSFLFSPLEESDLHTIIRAFVDQTAKEGCTILQQGDEGDKLYLIETGTVSVSKVTSQDEKPIFLCELTSGDIFGELALLYNAPRAATVVALTDVQLWALDRETFNYIVRDATIKKREMYEGLLKEVEILKDMDNYERSKVADAIKSFSFKAGTNIIQEGDIGDTFYILTSGLAEAIKNGQVIKQYSQGDYFGELALLKNQPRAATVIAKSDCSTISLDRKSFKRLLGPVENILIRNTEVYRGKLLELGIDVSFLDKQ
ncbi:cyclic nucleotide-binding domain-containing protein [Cardiosporidium cionae]|uniref:Cyclic nucleotide-binding domain-containing protein n=1 Tax=Cardiosporidium cionae TaxID=476202 RepID=A0ABQ7JAG5_9APIC|nr:cyclic nucleotide-binding domain-containing protein [Cardiosporidium cionae]|eukprot:KAF8820991.1 cyclic nucleotide-binding domain-containing protein [Cardiosporidium cionae]